MPRGPVSTEMKETDHLENCTPDDPCRECGELEDNE